MGLTLKEFHLFTKDLSTGTEIRMGTDYNNRPGHIEFDGTNFEFVIDWKEKTRITLGQFNEEVEKYKDSVNEETEIQSYDIDDFDTIKFSKVKFEDGVIVLVHT